MKKYFFVFFLLSLKTFAGDVDEWPFFDLLPPEVILNIYEFMDEDAGKLAVTRSDLWAMFALIKKLFCAI